MVSINKMYREKNLINMKYLFLFLSAGIFSCTKNISQTTPSCILQKINTFKSELKGNPPQSIIQYTYHNKIVFYVPPQCCDQYSDLFDDNCNLVGHPDGGFTGGGDGTIRNFFKEAKDPQTIWKDDR